jgi:hypothetical protein
MTNRDDPLHLAPLIERLAQEAWERANRADDLRSDEATSRQSSVLCRFTRDLVAIVAEECAKVCDAEPGGAGCAAEIRYLFAPDVKKPPEGGR